MVPMRLRRTIEPDLEQILGFCAEDPIERGMPGEWDADMQRYPSLLAHDGRLYLLYNGNEFGRYGFGAAVLDE